MAIPQQQLKMGKIEWLMLLLLSVVFGGAFFFFEIGTKTFDPITFVWFRVTPAAILLWLFIALSRRAIPKTPYAWIAFGIQSVLNNIIPFSLIAWAQTHIDSSLSSILNATTPLWTALIVGLALNDEQLTINKLIGIALGVCGVTCMIGFDALQALGGNTILAQCAVIVAAISYGFAGLWGRRFQAMSIDPIVAAAGQVTSSSVLLLPVVLFVDPAWQYIGIAPIEAWLSVLGISVLSTAIAYVLFFQLMARAGAVNLSLSCFLVPISATLLGVCILGEKITLFHLFGAAIIAVALLLIDERFFVRISSKLATKLRARHGRKTKVNI